MRDQWKRVPQCTIQIFITNNTFDSIHIFSYIMGSTVFDIGDEVKVALQLLKMANIIEGREDVVRVAHPAEAVVPVTGAAGGFGQAGGAGRNHGPGVFVLVNFQGQSRANHLRLVEAANAGALHPVAPVGRRAQ